MATDISFTHRDTFLLCHIQGDPLTDEERHSVLVQMIDEATKDNLDILVHEDTPGAQPRTATEYIARANFLGTTGFKKRIAYVHPGFSDDTCELIENAAWNYGRKVRLFSELEIATRWIESQEDDHV